MKRASKDNKSCLKVALAAVMQKELALKHASAPLKIYNYDQGDGDENGDNDVMLAKPSAERLGGGARCRRSLGRL